MCKTAEVFAHQKGPFIINLSSQDIAPQPIYNILVQKLQGSKIIHIFSNRSIHVKVGINQIAEHFSPKNEWEIASSAKKC